MLREFVMLTEEAVKEGTERGISLFMESLEDDLAKGEVIAECGSVENALVNLFENEGYAVTGNVECLDESKMDTMLSQFKKEGLL